MVLDKNKITNRFSLRQDGVWSNHRHYEKTEIKTEIRKQDDTVCYQFSTTHQPEEFHEEFNLPEIRNAKTTVKKVERQFRKLNIKLTQELREIYMDENQNLVFGNVYLEETGILGRRFHAEDGDNMNLVELMKLIKNQEESFESRINKAE